MYACLWVILPNTVDPGCSLDEFVIEPRSFRTELEEAQNRHDYESEVSSQLLPTKQQILSCLATHGHWITTQVELQVYVYNTASPVMNILLMNNLYSVL